MEKFKVGDKVRVKDIEVGTFSNGCRFAEGMSKYIGKEFTIDTYYDDGNYSLNTLWYFWAEEWLESAKPETIVIYRNGNKTVALDKTTGRKAEAKCSEEDTYDFYTSAKVAFERLIGDDNIKEGRKLYNGKVVCITSQYKDVTKGKIYEFKDGYSKYDDGARMPCILDAVTSFEDLKDKIGDEFIELVED